MAVKKAIDGGRITQEADGTINPERADREWEENTISPRKPAAAPKTVAPERNSSRPVAHEPAEPVAPVLSAGGTTLLQARTVNEVVRVQLNKVKLSEKRKELVDRSQAIAHVFRLARTERDAWLNWPARVSATMAAQLDVDAHALHFAMEAAVREHLMELGELKPQVD